MLGMDSKYSLSYSSIIDFLLLGLISVLGILASGLATSDKTLSNVN
tara:strand:- start:50 stop:187 length:138 start_codon:yes stop_codon:yes gene_type:complete